MSFNPWMIGCIVLIAVVAKLVAKNMTRKGLRIDAAVDDTQEVYCSLAGILKSMFLPKLSKICTKMSSINVAGTIKESRELVTLAEEGGPTYILGMLAENFYKYQLPERMQLHEDRAKIVKAVLGNPETKAEIEAALAEAKAK